MLPYLFNPHCLAASLDYKRKVMYLGPPGTFCHVAARAHFGDSADYVPLEDMQQLFEAVRGNKAAYGIVPFYNSQSGHMRDTQDLLFDMQVRGRAKGHSSI